MFISDIYSQYPGWRRVIDKATFDISVNPRNPQTFFAGGEGRRFFRSWDGGNNWDTVLIGGFIQSSTTFNNVIIHPRDTNIVLVGGLKFEVIERSTDAGQTWNIALSRPPGNSVSLNGKSMMFKPDAPDTAYLGELVDGIVFRSIDKGKTWDSIGHLTRTVKVKESDGTLVDSTFTTNIGATAIREDSTNILVFGSTHGEMFVSKNGGYNWDFMGYLTRPDSIQSDCEITRIVFSDRDPKVGYACITYLFLLNKNNGGLYQTTDGGYNWHQIAFPDTSIWALSCRGYGKSDEIFIGGYTEDFYELDTMRIPGVGIIRRSQDGGKTWWSYDPTMNWALEYPKTNSNIESLYFPAKDTGFAVGNSGVILRTTNRGENWNLVIYSGDNNFKSTVFKDTKTGFIVDDAGSIYKTSNRGIAWNSVYTGGSQSFNSIAKIDDSTYIAAGANGLIMKSNDEGKTWNKIASNTNKFLFSIFFPDTKTGYICGDSGLILNSTDGGASWLQQQSNTLFNLKYVSFKDIKTGMIVGDSATCLKTTDGGNNWNKVNVPTKVHLFSVCYPKNGSGSTVYLTGETGLLLKSTDTGNSWISLNSLTARPLYASSFWDDNTGFSAGKWEVIIKTTNGGDIWTIPGWGYGPRANMWSLRYLGAQGSEKLFMTTEAGLFVLDYPSYIEQIMKNENNPAFKAIPNNNSLTVYYNNKTENNLFFRIADIKGNIVYNQVFDNNGCDNFEYTISNLNLARGAYLCQLFDGRNVLSQIIIVN